MQQMNTTTSYRENALPQRGFAEVRADMNISVHEIQSTPYDTFRFPGSTPERARVQNARPKNQSSGENQDAGLNTVIADAYHFAKSSQPQERQLSSEEVHQLAQRLIETARVLDWDRTQMEQGV